MDEEHFQPDVWNLKARKLSRRKKTDWINVISVIIFLGTASAAVVFLTTDDPVRQLGEIWQTEVMDLFL